MKKEGDVDFAVVTTTSDVLIGILKKEVIKEFPSLQGKDPSTLTLHFANDKEGKILGPPLESTLTIEKALVHAKELMDGKDEEIIRIVVRSTSTGEFVFVYQVLGRIQLLTSP